ncbi:uncharacterized [Tachysurus ichikawai]
MGGPNEMLIQARQCQEFVIGAQLLLGLWSGEEAAGRSEPSASVCRFKSRAGTSHSEFTFIDHVEHAAK